MKAMRMKNIGILGLVVPLSHTVQDAPAMDRLSRETNWIIGKILRSNNALKAKEAIDDDESNIYPEKKDGLDVLNIKLNSMNESDEYNGLMQLQSRKDEISRHKAITQEEAELLTDYRIE